MKTEDKPNGETRLELSKKQQKRLNAAKEQRAQLEVKIEAQLKILAGQRKVVVSMEHLLDTLKSELLKAEEYIDKLYTE